MNIIRKIMTVSFPIMLLLSFGSVFGAVHAGQAQTHQDQEDLAQIEEWEIIWVENTGLTRSVEQLEQLDGWERNSSALGLSARPSEGNYEGWVRITLPVIEEEQAGIMLNRISAYHLSILMNNQQLYETRIDHSYQYNRVLLPLTSVDSNQHLYIGLETNKDEINLQQQIQIGNYHELLSHYIKKDLIDIILSGACIFISLVMLVCSIFINRSFLVSWLSLSIVVCAIGVLVVTYSPFLFVFYGNQGELYTLIFDIALLLLLPSLMIFFEKLFGRGYLSLVTTVRKFLVLYSSLSLVVLLLNQLLDEQLRALYRFMSVDMLGYIIILQCVVLLTHLMINAIRKNVDAIIITIGLSLLAGAGLIEIILYYTLPMVYQFFLWKWGGIGAIIAMIATIGRRFAMNHALIVQYSKELELFNNELQRSEKMEIISELAASVAHEVRNPLQVTRGFIQLMLERNQGKQQNDYLTLALDELDRASDIITDFLTFAKPQFDRVTLLHISEEFIHIESLLMPLANLQGSTMTVTVPENIYIRGNASKFKQAFINIIKNSIEALQEEGHIAIWAYTENEQVVIHVKDTGEGMTEAELVRLGEPYYSNKSKGTGLGLMVTFRIIEVMEGSITFQSKKGVGTEAVIRFPAAIP